MKEKIILFLIRWTSLCYQVLPRSCSSYQWYSWSFLIMFFVCYVFSTFLTGHSYAESWCSVLAQVGRCMLQPGCHGGTCVSEVCEPALRIQGISEPWFHDVRDFVALPFQNFYPYYFQLWSSWLVLAAWLGGAVLWAIVMQLCRDESWWCNWRWVYLLTDDSGSSLGQH